MGWAMRAPRRASGYTVAEYYGLVDEGVLGEDDHTELLEGVIVAGEPQNPPHASGVWRVHRALERAVGERAIVRAQLDYIAGRRSAPEPDVAVVPLDPDGYATAHPSRAYALFEISDSPRTQPPPPHPPAPPLLRAHGPSSWRAPHAGRPPGRDDRGGRLPPPSHDASPQGVAAGRRRARRSRRSSRGRAPAYRPSAP